MDVYHNLEGDGNCRCFMQDEGRLSGCPDGEKQSVQGEELLPCLYTFVSRRTTERNGV